MTAPLILSLALDEPSFLFFNTLRQKHFPPERNYLDAHLTLFHALPGEEYETICRQLETLCQQISPMQLQVTEVKMIGRGVAYKMECDALKHLHHQLRKNWLEWLTAQDRQKIWPHVTVQNKASVEQARELYAELRQKFEPFTTTDTGLTIWAYRNGPWEKLKEFSFTES
jgi:2'-5' RNA ligase